MVINAAIKGDASLATTHLIHYSLGWNISLPLFEVALRNCTEQETSNPEPY